MMVKVLGLTLALFLIALGAMWTLQGSGNLGSAGASSSLATLGPIVAGFGVALVYVILRGRR